MKRLSEILADPDASGTYQLDGTVPTDAIEEVCAKDHVAFFRVPGADVRTKDEFLQTVAAALGFPSYFGNNWDALEDCLKDLSWHPARGYVILLDTVGPFAEGQPAEFGIAMDIMRESCAFWREQGKICIALFAGTGIEAGTEESVEL